MLPKNTTTIGINNHYLSKTMTQLHETTSPDAAAILITSKTTTSSSVKNSRSISTNNNKSKKNITSYPKLDYSARYYAVKALIPMNYNNNNIPSFSVDRLESNKQYQTSLSTRDRTFCRLLVSTTERRIGQIDTIIELLSNNNKDKENNKKNNDNNNKKKTFKKRPSMADAHVTATLRVGLAQLLFIPSIPKYAAVKDTVDVLRMIQQSSNNITIPETKISFVNAILRRITRENDINELLNHNTSITTNVSPWLLQQLYNDWGIESTNIILNIFMEESPRSLSMNYNVIHNIIHNNNHKNNNIMTTTNNYVPIDNDNNNHLDNNDHQQHHHHKNGMTRHQQIDISNFVNQYFPNSTILPQGSVIVHQSPPLLIKQEQEQPQSLLSSTTTSLDTNINTANSNTTTTTANNYNTISSWPYYNDGAWWFQDPSATIPALALYQTISNGGTININDRNIIDMCASPGGKTAQLYNYGFIKNIIAIDISKKRVERLIQNKQRLQMDWNIVIADGTKYIPTVLPIDGVLLDVPCTATGTASKRPDVLRNSNADISILLQTQYSLACHTIDNILDIGGILIYSTCSILKIESEDQIIKLLNHYNNNDNNNNHFRIQLLPFHIDEIPGFNECIDDEYGWIRVLPGHITEYGNIMTKVDGFFVARLEKIRK